MLSCTACLVSEKAPEITAWLAITVAAVASTTIGISVHPWFISKNGWPTTPPCASTKAPCPA